MPRVHSCPPPHWRASSELSRTTAILMVFQVDSQHERITDVYVGLMVHWVESCLYTPDQILDFVADIEVNLKVACDALKAGGDPGKRCAFYLFVSNYGGMLSFPTDPPYCLIYPTSYVMQHMNDNPNQHREHASSHLILPHGAQYEEQLFPKILEHWNHWVLLTNSVTKEPFLMELVGDFRSMDSIFKGCYGDSFLYPDVDLG